MTNLRVALHAAKAESASHAVPLSCSVPWPRGSLGNGNTVALHDSDGASIPVQIDVLDRWFDGSARWTLLDWQGKFTASTVYNVQVTSTERVSHALHGIVFEHSVETAVVNTGLARFELAVGSGFPIRAVRIRGSRIADGPCCGFIVEGEPGGQLAARVTRLDVEINGPIRTVVRAYGVLIDVTGTPVAMSDMRMHFFAGSGAVRFDLTICNPRKADHPGGLWDLGNGGSIYLRDAALTLGLPPGDGATQAYCSAENDSHFTEVPLPLELYQDSSGGENWRSSNHINRRRTVPTTFRGFRLRTRETERYGLRATPAVYIRRGGQAIGATMPCFWQNFPKAIEASADGTLTLRLFPRQYSDIHEIQGGEQKTHTFSMVFGSEEPIEHVLAWCRTPPRVSASAEWYCSSGALPYLIPRADDPNPVYLQLVDAAIEGQDTFDHKREVIDEYGWRHFGDIYGDHEAVFHKGPTPLVSHYNNQYDPIAGFAYQFFRSGDFRWLRHMEELAAHVVDIDLYHTEQDKWAYNHGLFWHTYHYVDADTGTHRSYPRAAKVCGGGPANEHNYTTGLMLHYFLTGSSAAREAVIAMGRWVIDMDDGDKRIFRWLARGDTGLASSSRTPTYHGPGRGAANSVAALLDAHRLSGDPAFLAKAEQLIRRCIHPADDVPARKLLDAENRWFYTMFLQSLGRYLDYKAERGELDERYAYARASLLHYTRWMAEHEYPYLEKPKILEYPTETWAAQDMRKSEIFKYAALHAVGPERVRFLERSGFFFRDSTTTLAAMQTRTLARPVVLLLSYGFMHAYFQRHPETQAPPPAAAHYDFGRPEVFVPQKHRALKRLKALLAATGIVGLLGAAAAAAVWFR